MIKLSVVIITLNEEKNLGRCLNSVKEVADEIVIVDSYSIDNTVKIAEKYNARIISQRFLGHVEQKNFASSKAKYDWVLSLDADEELDEQLKQSILKAKANPVAKAYKFARLNNFCGKWVRHSGWYPDAKIRLYDRNAGMWKGENPHDKWELHNRYGKVAWLKGNLLHYSFHSISDYIKKIEKYSEIASRLRVEKEKSYSILKIIVVPQWLFFVNFVLRLGFLDGYTGWMVCRLVAMETMIKYAKTRQYAQWKKEGKPF